MEKLSKRMLPVGRPISEAEAVLDCSFAIEYCGPPVPYDIPRAIPIEIERIPIASVVSPASLPDRLSLPVVQPILSSEPLKKHPKNESLIPDAVVSPTSVIAFDRNELDGFDPEISGEIGTSGASGSSSGPDLSRELSGGLEEAGFSSEFKESVDFSNGTNPSDDRVSTESALSSEFGFRSSASCDRGSPDHHVKHAPAVTFGGDSRGHEADLAEQLVEGSVQEREEEEEEEESEPKVKKGSCYRCLRGNRFTEKEVCIVCDAKYCSGCVLRAMGSMPEGRKCVSCIGFPIEESKRERLGKCSRMLKKLLSSLEIQQAMKAEKYCEANQLRSEHVHVNGKQLIQEELVLLLNCPNPPGKLKPGRYWYDKVSGFWGKEGHKPHQIISPHLNVGGSLMPDASNGNTGIFINGRQITKVELRMLHWAGVQCAGNPHFWVNADGTYQEEGQKNIKGQIWGKAGVKLVCSVLSLPVPCKTINPAGEEMINVVSRAVPDYLERKTLQKLLLFGYHGSGTSTIFKQAKFLYKPVPFSKEERESIKLMIQSNIYIYLCILLEGRERFEEESLAGKRTKLSLPQSAALGNESDESDDRTVYSIGPRLKAFSDWLLKVMLSGNLEAIFPAATREYAPLVEELWNDYAIQATYSRRSELQLLPSVASYFLERVVDMSRMEYEPSDMDILYADGITSSNGLACTDFHFPPAACDGSGTEASEQHDALLRFQLIRVHSKGLGENCKWLEMFEDVRIIIFCIAMSDYDEYCEDAHGVAVNKMLASKKLFESIATHPTFDQMDFLLVLNKFDILEQKIDQAPLSSCNWFDDFNPVISRHRPNSRSLNSAASPALQAFHYIAVKFKRLFASLTGRKLYVTMGNGLDSASVDALLRYAREIVRWQEESSVFGTPDHSAYSTEPSSFSQ